MSSINRNLICQKPALISLSELQKGITQEYQRIYSNEPSHIITEIDLIRCRSIPKLFPSKLTMNFNRFFGLGQCLLYEMFTVVVFEHLYTSTNQIKRQTLQNLKWLIYDENFMEGNFYTKGMVVQGLRLMQQKSVDFNYENFIIQPLLQRGLMAAFVECWKQLIDRICLEYSMELIKEQDELEIMELLSAYFKIQFGISVQNNGKIQEILACSSSETHISIVFNNEDCQGESLGWKTFVLLDNIANPPPQSKALKFLKSLERNKPFEVISQENQSGLIIPVDEESSISRVDINCSQNQHEELKIILDNKHLENTAVKKESPSSEKPFNLSEILKKSKQTIQIGENLIGNFERFCQDFNY